MHVIISCAWRKRTHPPASFARLLAVLAKTPKHSLQEHQFCGKFPTMFWEIRLHHSTRGTVLCILGSTSENPLGPAAKRFTGFSPRTSRPSSKSSQTAKRKWRQWLLGAFKIRQSCTLSNVPRHLELSNWILRRNPKHPSIVETPISTSHLDPCFTTLSNFATKTLPCCPPR